jgi:hypothetical protein
MQQLILLLTSFLLGCGFPAFLIGLYSIRIWESHIRSLSLSFVGLDSSGSGRDRPKSKLRKSHKERRKDRCKVTGGDRPGREKSPSSSFSYTNKWSGLSWCLHLILWMWCLLVDRPLASTSNVVSPLGRGGRRSHSIGPRLRSVPFADSRLCCLG